MQNLSGNPVYILSVWTLFLEYMLLQDENDPFEDSRFRTPQGLQANALGSLTAELQPPPLVQDSTT